MPMLPALRLLIWACMRMYIHTWPMLSCLAFPPACVAWHYTSCACQSTIQRCLPNIQTYTHIFVPHLFARIVGCQALVSD